MLRYPFFILVAFTLVTASCKFNPNMQGEGYDKIQGIWEEGDVLLQNERLQYSRHKFRFTCDSVYLTIETFAQVNTYPDSCFNNGQWTEYAKGTYEAREDTLLLTTTFTKGNFKQKISGCYRSGQYLPVYIIRSLKGDSLTLESLQQHVKLAMYRTERTSCIPQAL